MKLGWVDLGDGAGIAASGDGSTLTLSGSIEGGGLVGDEGRRAQLASLRPGAVLPLLAGDGNYERPELDGLYRLAEVSYDHVPTLPWTMSLERLAGGSISGETAVTGLQIPTDPDAYFANTSPRFGIPGNLEQSSPNVGHGPVWRVNDLSEGRVYTAVLVLSSGNVGWVSFTCAPGEFLAGSPRVEIKAGGRWVTLHGQPPAGVPVRVHNGMYGLQLPVGGLGAKLLEVHPVTGAITEYPMKINEWDATLGVEVEWLDSGGVEVLRADAEMVWLRYGSDRVEQPHGGLSEEARRRVKGATTDVSIRRGINGFTVAHNVRAVVSMETLVPVGNSVDSGGSTVVGIQWPVGSIIGWRKAVTRVGSPPYRLRDLELWRFEGGTDTFVQRSWADPKVTIHR